MSKIIDERSQISKSMLLEDSVMTLTVSRYLQQCTVQYLKLLTQHLTLFL